MVVAPLAGALERLGILEKSMEYNTKSISDLHHERWLAPVALACCILLCRRCASRIFDTTKYIVCAASPREHPAKEGEDGENWTHSNRSEAKAVVVCPYCGSTDTEPFSLFGQQLLTMQYYCNTCHTPFERIKDDDVLDDYAARKEEQA